MAFATQLGAGEKDAAYEPKRTRGLSAPVVSMVLACLFGSNLAGCASAQRHEPDEAPEPSQHGCVALTFDDKHIADWFELRPLLRRYLCRATFLIRAPDRLTEREVELLRLLQADGHEIGCHGFRHVNAAEYLWTHTAREYLETEVLPAIAALRSHGFEPTSWAYPYGSAPPQLDRLLLEHFWVLRGVSYSVDARSMFVEGRKSRVSALGIDRNYRVRDSDIKRMLHQAARDNTTVVFYAHRPASRPTGSYQVSMARLQMILRTGTALGMRFVTLSTIAPDRD